MATLSVVLFDFFPPTFNLIFEHRKLENQNQ